MSTESMISVNELKKTYIMGAEQVHATAIREPGYWQKRVCCTHGPFGLWQINPDESAGLPRYTNQRKVFPQWHQCQHDGRRRTG